MKDNSNNNKKEVLPLMNEQIRAVEVQLIDHEGVNVGAVPRAQALKMAEVVGLDLVMLSEGKDGVPVVKIMDLGKSLYEKKKKQSESKKHQKVIQVKEIKLRPKIGEHDYQTKINQAVQFLKEGKRLKVTLFFKGRENVLKESHGLELFDKIDKSFDDAGLAKSLVQEKDAKLGQYWSRIYYLKTGK
ncbi:MAG: translation initiation factor IF-3 [Candidatus Babeliales bacterium]|nr:translation initiation factor IF-3 [Candidatus Babeliales bacterium]